MKNPTIYIWRKMSSRWLDTIGIVAISLAANLLFSFQATGLPRMVNWLVVICVGIGGFTLSLGAQELSEMNSEISKEHERSPDREEKLTAAKFEQEFNNRLIRADWKGIVLLGNITAILWLTALVGVVSYSASFRMNH
jgi:hypothetical protein